jgi:hypothetical protein
MKTAAVLACGSVSPKKKTTKMNLRGWDARHTVPSRSRGRDGGAPFRPWFDPVEAGVLRRTPAREAAGAARACDLANLEHERPVGRRLQFKPRAHAEAAVRRFAGVNMALSEIALGNLSVPPTRSLRV